MTIMSRPGVTQGPQVELDLCRAEVGAGYVWIQFRLAPVPDAVRRHPRVRDLPCGTALCGDRRLDECRLSYRIGLDNVHVDGVVAVGPVPDAGTVRICFPPLPGIAGYEDRVLELSVDLAGAAVVRVATTGLS